ncbi:MAG: periplasmic copper chaperone [Alphaproteobacteria bacterium]|jgi:uncharacterized protein YcnI|nr:periplasmic copper chaperone [Alphaproteobacteria bacterium]
MIRCFILAAASVALSSTAFAHITLETRQAPLGASYKAVVRVPHGCEGFATTGIHIKIPEGVVSVKPMPKPGWTIELVKGKYAKTHDGGENAKISEGVVEIAWSGGKLPDAYYDEFIFRAFLATDLEPGKALYFPTVQQCEKGTHRWIEIPATGKSMDDYPEPAPDLMIMPKK